jgi:hypothetical protein
MFNALTREDTGALGGPEASLQVRSKIPAVQIVRTWRTTLLPRAADHGPASRIQGRPHPREQPVSKISQLEPAAAVSSGTEPGDELDLDGDAERQLGEANR